MFKTENIITLCFIGLIICTLAQCINNTNTEHFYFWNIPTKINRSLYDIRGYPITNGIYYFIHRGKLYNNRYIDYNKYSNLYMYLPYYHNGMIYMANGRYTYDKFIEKYDMPILYPVSYDVIDWYGLINNGIIDLNK